MRLKVFAIIALLLVAGGATVAAMGGFVPAATTATNLLTATASVSDVTDQIAATGTVEAAEQYSLWFGTAPVVSDGAAEIDGSSTAQGDPTAAGVSWPATDVQVAIGDRVTEGQVLATADTADLEAQIAEAGRTASSAALQLRIAEENLDDATTTDTRRQARLSLYGAQGADARAAADLAALEALRDHTTLVSPGDGIVTDVSISAGSGAPDGAAITIISSDLRVVTSVVESDIAAIDEGQEATVSVTAIDASLRGTVTSIDPVGAGSGANGVVAYAVNVALDAPPADLRPGMSADISIVAASATNVLAIPSRALTGSAGSYTVRVMAQDSSVSVRPVEVGLVTNSLAEVTSGLQAGDRVVTGTSSAQNQGANVGGPGGGVLPGGGQVIRGNP